MEVRLNPFAAFFWSLLWPGLGQLYTGRPRRAALFLIAPPLCMLATFALALNFGPAGFYEGILLSPAVRLISAGEAAYFASRHRFTTGTSGRGKGFLLTLGVCLEAVFWIVAQQTLPAWPVRTFYIPSGAMIPTLMINDFIAVDHWARPRLDDIVVFTPPDTYERSRQAHRGRLFKDGCLWRNGRRVEEPWVHEPFQGPAEEQAVPPGHFYMLGDNRNNSSDSRVFGPVPAENVLGRVMYIYWPYDRARTF